MRAREFLFEYRRDLTINKFKDRLANALKKLNPAYAYDDFYQSQWILANAHTKPLPQGKSVRVPVFGNSLLINNENIAEIAKEITPILIEKFVEFFEERDPTPNKKYTPWMIQAFINDPNSVRMEDFNGHDLLELYDKNKHRVKPEHRDINEFKNYYAFFREIWPYKFQDEEPAETDRGEFEEVYEDDKVRVVKPLDQKAACYYGRGTVWCTAATRSENRFKNYNEKGPLYILMPKKRSYEGEKYQIHPSTEEYANESNDNVGFSRIVKDFPEFMNYLATIDKDVGNLCYFVDVDELDQIADAIKELSIICFEKLQPNRRLRGKYYDWLEQKVFGDSEYYSDDGLILSAIEKNPDLSFTSYLKEYLNSVNSDFIDKDTGLPKQFTYAMDKFTGDYIKTTMADIKVVSLTREYASLFTINSEFNEIMSNSIIMNIAVREIEAEKLYNEITTEHYKVGLLHEKIQ